MQLDGVKQDAFHIMNRQYIGISNSAHTDYYKDFSKAMFLSCEEDLAKVRSVLELKFGFNEAAADNYLRDNPSYARARIRRHIPAPAQLYARLKRFFETYQNIR